MNEPDPAMIEVSESPGNRERVSPPRDLVALAITPGEPAGVGPDLLVRLIQEPQDALLVAVADPDLLESRARALGLGLRLHRFERDGRAPDGWIGEWPDIPPPGQLAIIPIDLREPSTPGRLAVANAAYVLETLAMACDRCRSGDLDALVTGPVHKGIINDAGLHFTGHTEFLAEQCGATPVMMLTTPGLRVALVTTHLSLSRVSEAITRDHLREVIAILRRDLVLRLGIPEPRILVCGLNPHAGEGGHLGREEIEVIEPVLDELRTLGWNLIGPLPALPFEVVKP